MFKFDLLQFIALISELWKKKHQFWLTWNQQCRSLDGRLKAEEQWWAHLSWDDFLFINAFFFPDLCIFLYIQTNLTLAEVVVSLFLFLQRYHTPTRSKSRSASVEERGSSETPPHWKEEMKKTKMYQPPSVERWSKGDKYDFTLLFPKR